MSMPSSRLDVATSAGRRPALSSSSISRRCSRAMLPWWARTSSSPASSLRRWASRSARRRLLVKTIVLRCSRISSRIRGWIAGQMLVRSLGAGGRAAGLLVERQDLAEARPCPRPGRRPGGRAACARRRRRSSTSRSGPTPPRNRAIASSGRWVALRPIRWSGGGVRRRGGARAAPGSARGGRRASCRRSRGPRRRSRARRRARISRAWLVSIRYSDSGVVMRMSGGWRASSRRSSAGVSPVRLATRDRRRRLAEPLRPRGRCRPAARGGCARRRRSGP